MSHLVLTASFILSSGCEGSPLTPLQDPQRLAGYAKDHKGTP
jgi:hypothetical protein